MRTPLRNWGITFVAICFFGSHVLFSSAPPQIKPKLQVTAELANTDVTLQSILQFKIRLKNTSQETISLYKKLDIGTWSGLQLLIFDEGNGLVPSTTFDEPLFTGRNHLVPKRDDFIALKPNETLEIRTETGVSNYLIKTPGKYTAIISYYNPIPRQLVPDGLILFGNSSQFFSAEPVAFTIKE